MQITANRCFPKQLFSALVLLAVFSAPIVARGQAASPAKVNQVVTIKLESKLVKTVLPYNVVLPADYESPAAKTTRYSVLYLLHGLTGHYPDWTTKTKLVNYSTQYRLIIVTPEGNNGWYTDSATNPVDKYESYILEELIPDVQRHFRTNESREGRAIAGLSMGGYGALKFAVKHPEMFVFAASMSGAIDAAEWTKEDLSGLELIWRSLEPVYGPSDSPVRAANDLPKLYANVTPERVAALPYLYLDCGTEDRLLPSNRRLEEILLERKIPHEFRLLPGGHTWTYWDRQIQEVLRVAAARVPELQ